MTNQCVHMLFMMVRFIYSSDTTRCLKAGDLHCFLVDQTENVSCLSVGLIIAVNFLLCVKTSLILKPYFFFFLSTASNLLIPWPRRLKIFKQSSKIYLMAAYLSWRLSCCDWKSHFAVVVSWPVPDVKCGLTAL